MMACMEQAGWKTIVNPDFSLSASSNLSEEQKDLQNKALFACSDQVYSDEPVRNASFWRVMYAHALDTRDCIVAAGYSIPDPPSEAAWVDAA
jgi:hypothetical protein